MGTPPLRIQHIYIPVFMLSTQTNRSETLHKQDGLESKAERNDRATAYGRRRRKSVRME